MKLKKLLILTDTYIPRYDGVSRFLIEVLPGIKNFNIEIIAPDYRTDMKFSFDYKVTLFKPITFSVSDYSPAFPKFRILKDKIKSADLVFSQTMGPIGIVGSYYAKKYNKTLISFVHSIDWELFANALNVSKFLKRILMKLAEIIPRWIYNKNDLILVPSREAEISLTKQGITSPKRILNLGTNVNTFVPVKNKTLLKKKYGFEKDDIIIGYVGRISYEKDLSVLYKAYKNIKRVYPDRHIKLLIVGDGEDSIKDTFKNKDVIITGFVSSVIEFLQIMNIYVLPSLTETSSISTMEAMSVGLPVITTKVGFLNTYIDEGVNGLHMEKSDMDDLIEKLKLLIDNSKLRDKLGKAARETIVKNYSWRSTIQKLNRILNTILESIN